MLNPGKEDFFYERITSKRKTFNFRTIIMVIIMFILLALTVGITYLITQNMSKSNKMIK